MSVDIPLTINFLCVLINQDLPIKQAGFSRNTKACVDGIWGLKTIREIPILCIETSPIVDARGGDIVTLRVAKPSAGLLIGKHFLGHDVFDFQK
jgi:hypothetical protein